MSQKRKDIQGVRAWAVILVLLFHFFPSLFPNGYVGVDMFFVVSGFLMAMIISKHGELNISTFKLFYYRRIRRILPLYYLVLLLILVVVVSVLPSSFRSTNLLSGRKALLLTANLRTTDNANQTYANMLARAEDLFTHTWSLSVEMQWYLIVPIVYLIQRLLTSYERVFFCGLAAVSLAFYFFIGLDAAFYSVFARIWQFSCGILAFAWHREEKVYPETTEFIAADVEQKKQFQNEGYFKVKGYSILPKLKEVLTWSAFVLTVAVPFIAISLPARLLRIETTIATAILIYLGKQHQTILLTKSELVYLGDISYALYLFHWPVLIVIRYYYPANPLGPFLGIFVSGALATIAYNYYERSYLKSSPSTIISLLLALLCGCIFMSLRPIVVEDFDVEKLSIDLKKVDVKDAAWNMTLMRYIIAKERRGYQHMFHEECTYSNRFSNTSYIPHGLCTMKKGGGTVNFLVIGNSYACNQGNLIYQAFKPHANEFNIFCVIGCELWLATMNFCHPMPNFTQILEELKPDVVFFMIRHVRGKDAFDVTKALSEDEIYKYQTSFLDNVEKVVKKIYVLQACPSGRGDATQIALTFTQKGKPLNAIKDGLITRDDFFARQRMWELGKRCKKCEIVDYKPLLVEANGEFLGYNSTTNIMFFDEYHHLNTYGKQRIQILFDRLSKEFVIPQGI